MKYVSLLDHELHEQPEALRRLLTSQRDAAERAAELFRGGDVRYVLIASRGSSSNAARYAQYLLGRANRVPVMFATPSLYTIYEQPPSLDGGVIVGISQSGASPDVASVLAEARRQGRPTLAITNVADSPLAREADEILRLEAGDERAVAATKTYLNSLGAIALLFAAIGDDEVARAELARMPAAVDEQIELSFAALPSLEALSRTRGATVVARGVNYCTAHETALKIRELSSLVVEAYSPADLMHGPIAAIRPGWPVVAIAPSGPAQESVLSVLPALVERGADVLRISDLRDAELPLVAGVPEWLSPLTAVVPAQVTAMRLAELRGLDVDRPVGLKKVTLTR